MKQYSYLTHLILVLFTSSDHACISGWCYVKWVHGTTLGPAGDDRYLMPQIVGYEIWLYLTFFVLPVLYIWIRCYIRVKVWK